MTGHLNHHYIVLGSGRMGTAAAYDLVTHGEAAKIIMADLDEETAKRAALRVNSLTGQTIARPLVLDVRDLHAVQAALAGNDVALSAVPYYFNVDITKAAIGAGTHLVDMGGHTGVVRRQLGFDEAARAAAVTILPDCGMGPGIVNVLAVYAMEQLDVPEEVVVYDGGLPQQPEPPWNYRCAFNLNGLTNEYDGFVPLLRDGEIVEVEALSELQTVDFGHLGKFESFIAAGGSTAPWSFSGKLKRFETRVLRYPGHYAWFRGYKELGLFGEEPIDVGGHPVVPREVFHTLVAKHITTGLVQDVCLIRCMASGRKDDEQATIFIDLVDRYDEETGITAMERLTGWHCAMMMHFVAKGRVPVGAKALEALLLERTPSAASILEEIRKRGISWDIHWG